MHLRESTEILCTGPYVKCQLAAYEDTTDVNQSHCILGEVSNVIMLYHDIIKITSNRNVSINKENKIYIIVKTVSNKL